ncbi:MORN repeat-containing protein [Candidatus Protochlamydia phocaeensis]|uniref:MORN repeat-containing protein n=1 Tax=Candidatus Protochlamydia phocaeensis TaxID=1414722 RepID=UPI0008384456|nr:hypothetical protein [Candidatus Protochlamydia phocaeensis]
MHDNNINASNGNRSLIPIQTLFSQQRQAAGPSSVTNIALQAIDFQKDSAFGRPTIPMPGNALFFPGHLAFIPPISPSCYSLPIPFVAQQVLGFPQSVPQSSMKKRGLEEEEEADPAGKRQMLNQQEIRHPVVELARPLFHTMNDNQAAIEQAGEGNEVSGGVIAGELEGQEVFCRNGIRYEGQFRRGIAQSGVIKFADGTIYVGKIVDWKPQDKGTWICMNGKIYTGNFPYGHLGILTGNGTMKLPNGNIYIGLLIKGEARGKGKLMTRSGEVYEGIFQEDNGFKGHFTSNNQAKIKRSGVFENEKFLMSRTIHLENGDLYIGDVSKMEDFTKVQPNGYGMLIKANQSKFQGTFKQGKIEKIDRIYFSNGDQYEGETRDCQAHGEGIFTYINGIKLKGHFVDGSLQGNTATIEYLNGDRYEGEVADRMANGQGILTCRNGKRYEGKFENDLPVSLYHRS